MNDEKQTEENPIVILVTNRADSLDPVIARHSMKDELAEKILDSLESQRFYDFYNGDFANYITGETAIPRDDMIQKIKSIFRPVFPRRQR